MHLGDFWIRTRPQVTNLLCISLSLLRALLYIGIATLVPRDSDEV